MNYITSKTKIINLYGGPGIGKSVGAAYIFAHLKMKNVKCELVTEFAKSLTYQKRQHQLANQNYVHAKQDHYLRMASGQVDFLITDSPLLLSAIYVPSNYPASFTRFVIDNFNSFNNVNFYLRRVKEYQSYGRNQTATEAIEVDKKVLEFLTKNNIAFGVVEGSEAGYKEIIKCLI